MAKRMLRITTDWAASQVPRDIDDFELPKGWDAMTADQRDKVIATFGKELIWEKVLRSGGDVDGELDIEIEWPWADATETLTFDLPNDWGWWTPPERDARIARHLRVEVEKHNIKVTGDVVGVDD